MDYAAIAHIFVDLPSTVPTTAPPVSTTASSTPSAVSTNAPVNTAPATNTPPPAPINTQPATNQEPEPSYIQDIPPDELPVQQTPPPAPAPAPAPSPTPTSAGLPKALVDLMTAYKVTEEDIRKAVASKGYFPLDTPITSYPSDFIEGCLIGAWNQLYQIIKDAYPF